MKKLFLFAAIAGVALAGCSKNKAADYTMLITTTVATGAYKLYITGTGTATIDWGDSSSETVPLSNPPADFSNLYDYYVAHNYASAGVKSINITGNNILSLCTVTSGTITALDVTKMPTLKYLNCNVAKLSSLDISKNTALVYLECGNNNLTSLNVSNHTALKHFCCDGNNLTSLNVSGCAALETLYCHHNNLTSLNVSNCTALRNLGCSSNKLNFTALNTVFTALPTCLAASKGYICLENNPGTSQSGYNPSIATGKNWIIECL